MLVLPDQAGVAAGLAGGGLVKPQGAIRAGGFAMVVLMFALGASLARDARARSGLMKTGQAGHARTFAGTRHVVPLGAGDAHGGRLQRKRARGAGGATFNFIVAHFVVVVPLGAQQARGRRMVNLILTNDALFAGRLGGFVLVLPTDASIKYGVNVARLVRPGRRGGAFGGKIVLRRPSRRARFARGSRGGVLVQARHATFAPGLSVGILELALGASVATGLPVGTLVVPRGAVFATALLGPLVLVPAGAAIVAFVAPKFFLVPFSRGTIFTTKGLQASLRGVKGVGGVFGNHQRRQYPHSPSRCPRICRRGVRNRGRGGGGPVQRQRPNESE